MRRFEHKSPAARRLMVGFALAVSAVFLLAVSAALAGSRPEIGKELVAEVTTTEAKLGALVNPEGSLATYRFQYGATSSYGSSTPSSEGSVEEGLKSTAVWATASGLAPGTTYHYRVVVTYERATNEHVTTYGPDQTFTTLTAEQAACPNEEFRSGFSARLPDCRAYELVTPLVANSTQFFTSVNRRSPGVAGDGEAISLYLHESLPDAPNSGNNYLGTRGPGGWTVTDISPNEPYTGVVCPSYNTLMPSSQSFQGYSADFSKVLFEFGGKSSVTGFQASEACNADGLQVVSGEPVGHINLLVRDNATGAYRLVNAPPLGVIPNDAHFEGASADLSHVLFSEEGPLAQGAMYGAENLFEWDEGVLRLLTVLPNRASTPGSFVEGRGRKQRYEGHGISTDGSRILFTSGGDLYDRIDGERTVWVDESQEGAADPGGGGVFEAATADGSDVLFLDAHRLTPGSTAESGKPDLYECSLPIPLPATMSKCALTDLTVAKAGEHADVLAVSSLGPHDTSNVYYVARGVLATNTRNYVNSEGKPVSEGAQGGQPNLYVWDGETTRFIATLAEAETGQTSPDGAWYGFKSSRSLTGYDNISPLKDTPVSEYFLYSAATGQLTCASCKPTGEAPELGPDTSPVAASSGGAGPPRYVSEGGRLFFETSEALVPSDTNRHVDIYEYENGEVRLISSGTGSSDAVLAGASESGGDVFFNVAQALVPRDDQEGTIVGYDARVDGGFYEPVLPPPCTTADSCRAPVSPQSSLYGAPSSQTFDGAGNLAPPVEATTPRNRAKPKKCGRGFLRKKGKCVRKRARKAGKTRRSVRRGVGR